MSEPSERCLFQVQRDVFNSQQFGLSMGNLIPPSYRGESSPADELARAVAAAQAAGFRHLSCRTDTGDKTLIFALEQNGFLLVDTQVTFCYSLEGGAVPAVARRCEIRPCREEDLPALCAIAETSFRLGRYYADPALPDDLCGRYYANWTENSCRGFADRVVTACVDGVPVGFATGHWKPGETYARMGLIAVSEQARGRGAGRALEWAMVAWSAEQGDNSLRGFLHGTQLENLPMQRILTRLGFLPHGSCHVFQRMI